jgi:hypothetical protein
VVTTGLEGDAQGRQNPPPALNTRWPNSLTMGLTIIAICHTGVEEIIAPGIYPSLRLTLPAVP